MVGKWLAAKQVGQINPRTSLLGGDYQAVISNVPESWIQNTTGAFP
jgi:hypothetical protein